MKKKLNIDSITNELEGSSLFFTRSVTPPPAPVPEKVEPSLSDSSISAEPEVPKEKPEKTKKSKDSKTIKDDTMTPRYQDTMTPR